MRAIGINTFGLNRLLHENFEATFRTLREVGFSAVEPMVVFPQLQGGDPEIMAQRLRAAGQDGAFWTRPIAEKRIARLRDMGFSVQGVHLGLVGRTPGGLTAVLPDAAAFARRNGIAYLVHSPQKKTIQEIIPDAEAFQNGIEMLKEQGTELLFHCHYQEFAEDCGDTPFAYLLRKVPALRVELDVGWVQYAGQDVIALIERYSDRIAVLHLKDIAADGPDESGRPTFTAIGEGSIPLKDILRKAAGVKLSYTGLVIDQDASKEDMLADLRRGFQHVQEASKDIKNRGIGDKTDGI